MTINRILPAIAGVFLCVWCVAPLHAQFSGPETAAGVVGTGVVTIERQPNVMRLQLMLPADGKDVKEALAALKAREAAGHAQHDESSGGSGGPGSA
ncbi:MAG TPA: hypothetical protein VN541_02245 [Tepidisphaeraceae bacterium]|nr:hypothetical protein [Tepidisphaeraceae bacterium]